MKTNPLRNFAITDLSVGISLSDTTLNLITGGGSSLPDPSDGEYNVVIWNRSDYANPDNDPFREIFRIKSGAGDVKIIERPVVGNDYLDEGTHNIAQDHNIAGKTYSVMQSLTKSYIDAKQFEVYVTVGAKNANYIIDGTADDIQIQEAVDEANSAGKRVFLKYANYDVANTIDKKGCSIYGETMNGTVLKWSGDPSTAIMENTADNPFEIANITFDGINSANGVIGLQPNGVNCERPVLSRVKFFNCGIGLKTANGSYKFWDGTGYSVYFRYCAIGLEAGEYQFTLVDPLFSYNGTAIQLDTNSNIHISLGTCTLNNLDLYFAGSPENCSFNGVWFEESTTAVASCAGIDIYAKVLQFTACRFHTKSAIKLMGLENIIGMVSFTGCLFRTKDLGGGSESSTNVVGGTYTDISYLACMKMNLAGSLTPYGDLNIPTRIKTDTIIEHTTDNGVQIEGITCKDSILYVPTLLVVDTITQRTIGHIEVTSPIYCDTFAEKTLNNGIQLEGVTCKDNNLYAPGFVVTNEITQYSAGGVAINAVLKVNVINEYASDVGCTIEGVEIKDSGIKLVNAVSEFSTDTTLGGNSDTAVPTEKAVKTYIDTAVSGENMWDRASTTLSPHNSGDNISTTGGILSGTSANFTDFPKVKIIGSTGNTGFTLTGYSGLLGESVSDGSYLAFGVTGVSTSSGVYDSRAVCGFSKVGATADTAKAIGFYGESWDTHAGGQNIGLYVTAKNGAVNYSIYGADGILHNAGNIETEGTLLVNTINEYTTNNGVVIEGITLKDSIVYVPNFITTNEITQYSGTSVFINSDLLVTGHKLYFSANSYAEYNTGTTSIDFIIT